MVTRLAAQAAAGDAAGTRESAGQLSPATTVRRSDPATKQHHLMGTFAPRRRALPAGPEPSDNGTVGARLQAAYAHPRPDGQAWTAAYAHPRSDGQAWTARSLAEAAGCGRSSAAVSCNASAPRQRRTLGEPPELAVTGRGAWLCLPRHPGAAPAPPPPPPWQPPASHW
jgi:hypothetical protein